MNTRSVEPRKTPAQGRRSQADRRALSERGLVQAAVEIIPSQGVDAATFEAIGARAGYSRSLVTQRFGSKRALIDAVVGYARAASQQRYADRRVEELPGLDGLLTMIDLYVTALAASDELKTYFMLLAKAVADVSDLRAVFASQHDEVKVRLVEQVMRGQQDGSIRSDIDANAAALMIGSLELGLSMQLLVDPHMDLDPIRRTTLEVVRSSFTA